MENRISLHCRGGHPRTEELEYLHPPLRANEITLGEGLLATMGKRVRFALNSTHGLNVSGQGEQHRKQRKMLNPVFSIAHMREMIPIFYDVVHRVSRRPLKSAWFSE